MDYFPEYDSNYVPAKKYFRNIFSTLNHELAEKFINYSIKERNKQNVTQESKIELSEEIMEQINKQHFYFKQKGRALSMLVTSKEIYKVNRKRKKEYSAFDPSPEEIKDSKQKRHKPINYDSIKERNKFWKDQDEFEKALEEVENDKNSKVDDKMKVNNPK